MLRGEEGGRKRFESYPVVTGLEGMAFVGTVSRKDLVRERQKGKRGRKGNGAGRKSIDTLATMYGIVGNGTGVDRCFFLCARVAGGRAGRGRGG